MPTHTEPKLDWLLRFDPATDAAYERDTGEMRGLYLCRVSILGLILFNLYNASAALFMPDLIWESILLRTVIFTIPSLGVAYLFLKLPALHRERLCLIAMTVAFSIPVALFWLTTAPLGAFAFMELDLTLVFGSLVLQLRFRHNLVFTAIAFALMGLAIWTKPTLPSDLTLALELQAATVSVFVLLCNYVMERGRCHQYLAVLKARTRAHKAEQETVAVEQLALTDTLTGLPNRRALDEYLDGLFTKKTDVAVLMCDIDHFKLLNDTVGHAEGDACLHAVGKVMAELAAERDVFAARYGGEEFAVVLTGRGAIEVTRLADELLRRIQRIGFVHPSRPDGLGVVTFSIGAAQRLAAQDKRIGEVMQEADAALYDAKARAATDVFCLTI